MLYITSDGTCLYCVCEWGVLSEGPRLQAITPANLPHMAQSCLTARPPCCMWFLIPFIISGKWNYLCVYSFVLYLCVVAMCVVKTWLPVQVRCSSTCRSSVFCMLLVNLMSVWKHIFTPVVSIELTAYLHNIGLILWQTLCKSLSCLQRPTLLIISTENSSFVTV